MNIRAYILWTGKKSVTIADYAPTIEKGDCVKVFCGWRTVSKVIKRKDGNTTLLLN